jgi:hypothetical protein
MRWRPAVLLTTVLSWSAWGQTYTIATFAGGALPVNIPGTSASLGSDVPQYIAADRAGNVFFVDQNTVLRLDATTGILTLVAGNGTPGFSGDNGPAHQRPVGESREASPWILPATSTSPTPDNQSHPQGFERGDHHRGGKRDARFQRRQRPGHQRRVGRALRARRGFRRQPLHRRLRSTTASARSRTG